MVRTKEPKFRITYFNRYGKIRTRIVTAADEGQAKEKFRAIYENQTGFCPTVYQVVAWGW